MAFTLFLPYGSYKNSTEARLIEKLESQIPENEALRPLWNTFVTFVRKKYVESHAEACKIFSTTLKITQLVSKKENISNLWIELLESQTFSLLRLPALAPQNVYTFDAIIRLARRKQENFTVNIVPLDHTQSDTSEIAYAIRSISIETLGVGLCFAVNSYAKILASPSTYCLLAKHESTIIGCLAGTFLNIPQGKKKCSKVLHLHLLGRKADYPSINFMKLLLQFTERTKETFSDTDYLTACVIPDNTHAIAICEKQGFSELERIPQGLRENDLLFYKKKINRKCNSPTPLYAEVGEAIKKKRIEEGILSEPDSTNQSSLSSSFG